MTRHWRARIRGLLTHEWTLAVLIAIAVALIINRGALADPAHTLPRDIWDPSYHAYLLAWGGYALRHDPLGIWHYNAFYPAPYGLAFSDSLLGYAPFGLVGMGQEAAVLRYNAVYIGAYAMVLLGGYALARQLGLRPAPAALVGVALAMAPWRLSHTGHLNVLSTGGIFLSLAMLARGHGVRWLRPASPGPDHAGRVAGPPYRPGWAFAGWVMAAWQVSLGFAIGLPFLYLLLGIAVVSVVLWAVRHRDELRRRAWRAALPPRALLLADLAGGLVLSVVAMLLAWPYLRVLEIYPHFRRDVGWIELYSPPLSGLFIAPAESTLWGHVQAAARAALSVPGEMARLPGFALYALAAVGLFVSVWSVRVRVGLAAAAVITAVLSLGTNGPVGGKLGYLLLLHLPGFDGIRTPGRMIIWTTLALALLAGGAVGAWAQALRAAAERGRDPAEGRPSARARSRSGPALVARAAVLVPIVVVYLEGVGNIPHPEMPPAPPALSQVEAPILVLPLHEVMDTNVTLWTTDRFAPVVNGGTSQTPTEQNQVREVVATFPDRASVDHLREIGVRSVVVLRGRAAGTPYANADVVPIDGLPLTRQVYPDTVVFTIEP